MSSWEGPPGGPLRLTTSTRSSIPGRRRDLQVQVEVQELARERTESPPREGENRGASLAVTVGCQVGTGPGRRAGCGGQPSESTCAALAKTPAAALAGPTADSQAC